MPTASGTVDGKCRQRTLSERPFQPDLVLTVVQAGACGRRCRPGDHGLEQRTVTGQLQVVHSEDLTPHPLSRTATALT